MRRILVVEYDRNVAMTLLEGLDCLPNCEVVIAADGDEALERLDEHGFDLVVTDYKMPGTDGLTLAKRVRELHPQTEFFMITAHRDEALGRAYASGLIRLILDKPVGLERIRSAVLEILERPRLAAASGV